MAALSPLMEEILRSGGSVELTATGNSMRPMLLHRISKVRLAPPGSLQKGDLPLYRRDNGAFVLHRVIALQNGSYTLCGDAQWHPEPGIRPEQIVAVATDFCRRNRWRSCRGRAYRAYWQIWLWIRPMRRLVVGGSRKVFRMLRKLAK